MAAFRYDDLKAKPPEDERRAPFERATLVAGEEARPALAAAEALGAGYALARRLAMMPGNVCTPDTFAEVGRDLAERFGMQTTVLGRDGSPSSGWARSSASRRARRRTPSS
jgi:leucyl aminopeptidase